MTGKRSLFFTFGALLLLGIALYLSPSVGPRYRADALVFAKPYNNVLFTPAFEAKLVGMVPGVLRLQVFTTYSAILTAGIPGITNGVGIRVIAEGPTPEDAVRVANDAVNHLCLTTLTNYGTTGMIVDQAIAARTRRHSYLYDDFQPAVGRLFKR